VDRSDSEAAQLSSEAVARRLFCSALPGPGESVELGEEAAQHARVLRLGVGDALSLFDGRGGILPVRIDALGPGRLRCTASGPLLSFPRGPEVVLVQCLVKGKKLDDIVRMTTEIGVSAIHLALSERCVAQKTERDTHKIERLARIASQAARQSEQPYVPEIIEASDLEQVLRRAPDEAARLVLAERSEGPFVVAPEAPRLWLVVGPEGGLSSRDREILSHAKFVPTSLGRAILRTETAAVVGVALGLNQLGRAVDTLSRDHNNRPLNGT
jgi:16S rRNA (uracil1498-N3)-methyltransferase